MLNNKLPSFKELDLSGVVYDPLAVIATPTRELTTSSNVTTFLKESNISMSSKTLEKL